MIVVFDCGLINEYSTNAVLQLKDETGMTLSDGSGKTMFCIQMIGDTGRLMPIKCIPMFNCVDQVASELGDGVCMCVL